MNKYLAYTRKIADSTPPDRNRVVDTVRAGAILVVVVGHWLAASIWLQANDEIALMNSLEWIPYAGWVTWVVQVMPIFFVVGGYANGRALASQADRFEYGDWVTRRVRRLFTPVVPLLVAWTILIVVLGPFLPSDVVRAGAMSATVPVWFIAVYVAVTAIAPVAYRWWRSAGLWSIVILSLCAILVDYLRFGHNVPGLSWVNFLFVWMAVHQFGFWWAARERDRKPITIGMGLTIAGVSLGVLITVTWIGWYPVAMVGVPGAEVTNMTPPTFAIALLGFMQAGFIWVASGPIGRFARRPGPWHGVVAVSGVMMTIYLWHLTAMTLVASVFLFAFDGVVFRIEPGTTAWWLSRPVWLAALVTVTLALVAVFARFEWRVRDTPPPARTGFVIAGVLLVAGAAAAVAYFGLAAADATVNWIIPIAAFVGAGIMGAYPAQRIKKADSTLLDAPPDRGEERSEFVDPCAEALSRQELHHGATPCLRSFAGRILRESGQRVAEKISRDASEVRARTGIRGVLSKGHARRRWAHPHPRGPPGRRARIIGRWQWVLKQHNERPGRSVDGQRCTIRSISTSSYGKGRTPLDAPRHAEASCGERSVNMRPSTGDA